MLIAAVAAFSAFLLLTALVLLAGGGPTGLDGNITPSLWDWASHGAGRWSTLRALTRGGELIFRTVVIGAVVIACVMRGRLKAAVWAGLCALTYGLLNSAAKWLLGRPRPVGADPVLTFQESSFPSGHSGGAMTVAIVIACVVGMSLHGLARVAVMVLAFALPAVVGFTRIALGVHYPTDVLAGFALSVTWTMLLAVLVGQVSQRRARRPVVE